MNAPDPVDPVQQFREALLTRGIHPPAELVADGHIHRCDVEAPNGRNDASYLLHLDGIAAGGFQNWRDGLGWENWRSTDSHRLTPEERAAHARQVQQAARERQAEEAKRKAEAQRRTATIWDAASPANDDHPYLRAKGIRSHGLRVHERKLVVPMRDETGELHSLQFIDDAGGKLFLSGGRKKGCYFPIGTPDGEICIAEGYATAASIHEATGYVCAVAFDAGNLKPVARALRATHSDVRLIVCADDDHRRPANPGLTKAHEAAVAVGGLVAVPDFGEDQPDDATDFNDLHRLRGVDAVVAAIGCAIPALGDAHQTTAHAMTDDPRASDWRDPRPIQAVLRPVPPFNPIALLPESLREWIMDESDRMPTAPDFIAVAAIVALGAVIGARCAIKPKSKDDWLVIPNLWGGIVGPPSAKKSPAISAALKPLDRLIALAMDVHSKEMKAFDRNKSFFEARKDGLKSRVRAVARGTSKAGNLEATLEELREHDESAPEEPTLRRYKTNDSTIEKLGELLRANPNGLLVLRDELVGLLASWDREGREGDRAFFLEAWNGNNRFDTDRIGRGSIFVPNLCLSIFGGIQPDKLTGYLEQAAHALANDGMLQRFQLLVYPDSQPWQWRDRPPNRDAQRRAFAVFDTFAAFEPETWGAAPPDEFAKFPYFSFGVEAQNVFIEWSKDLHHERLPAEEHPIIAQHLIKYDKLFPSVALILHLVDCAATNKRVPVSAEAAMRAAAWCEYLEGHARRCYGLLMDDGLRAALALAEKARHGKIPDGFTARDVRRNQWANLTTKEAVGSAIDWLEDEGWLRAEETGGTGPGSGRRTCRYLINPHIPSGD